MQFPHHALIGAAVNIPIPDPTPVISFSPVVLPAPDRPVDMQLRVTAPSNGSQEPLPVILLAHGSGPSNWLSSLDGYIPLAEFWAAHGFAGKADFPLFGNPSFFPLLPPYCFSRGLPERVPIVWISGGVVSLCFPETPSPSPS